MKNLDIWDGAVVAGALLAIVGIGLFSIPAAMIAAGGCLYKIGTDGNRRFPRSG